eukprot:Tamp_19174.p1 GENE.Tamp_19174~~Tamp_19174.p1  ORF type:complete len:241 (+),score=26.94 Tamp_19174:433-1155(+)
MPSARAGRGGARVPSAELCAGSGHTSRHARAERRRANRRRSGRSRPWRPPGPCAALRLPGSAKRRGRRGAENPVFARWGHSSEKLNSTTEKGGQSPYWMGVTVSSAHSRAMFADVKLLHDLHAVHHLQSLSMANPRGLGFEDEPINASDYIISGISGNYEKSLENSAAATKEYSRGTAGNSNYRGISADIISNAIGGVVDYTGVTLADGTKQHTMYEDPRIAPYQAAKAAAAAEAAAGAS